MVLVEVDGRYLNVVTAIGERVYSAAEFADRLTQARQGQREAREEIFYFLRARFLSLAKLRVLEEDAQEVVQETMIVVEKHLSEFETVENLLAFTNAVMRNKIGNFYQKRDRRKVYEAQENNIPDPIYYMDGELEAAELERLVWKAVDQLCQKNPRCREILVGLCQGLSASDLSEKFQVSRSNIDSRVFRCRQALRKILKENYDLEV